MTHARDRDAAPAATGLGPFDSGLAGRIEWQVDRRAYGRIRDLRVALEGERIVLTGRSRTQHAKQLATQAVLDLEIPGDGATLANRIVVAR